MVAMEVTEAMVAGMVAATEATVDMEATDQV